MVVFLEIVIGLMVIIIICGVAGLPTNVGNAWIFGVAMSLGVMINLIDTRSRAEGVMLFCRSLGVPYIEEYAFSYSKQVEPENVRTLAKAMWNSGVGVWIDVLKLHDFNF